MTRKVCKRVLAAVACTLFIAPSSRAQDMPDTPSAKTTFQVSETTNERQAPLFAAGAGDLSSGFRAEMRPASVLTDSEAAKDSSATSPPHSERNSSFMSDRSEPRVQATRTVGGDDDRVGSANIPMDSWIYPALERLSALGYIPLQSVSIRPWTRRECLRQVRSADDELARDPIADGPAQREAERLLSDLIAELEEPAYKSEARLETVYARVGTIAGPAITDSAHFGQTWWNDFGRPLGRGSSFIAGYSGSLRYHRFFLYDRQEIQKTPGTLGLTASQASLFNSTDELLNQAQPLITYSASPSTGAYLRQRPIELYAGVAFAGNEISFGKQELYWGPTTMGPISFSSNAEPTYNLRFVATRPHPLPLLRRFGTYRFDAVFGKLSGHKNPARPYFNGLKVDFTFGKNLEMSFTRWSLIFGVGHPMTFRNLKRNVFSFNSTGPGYYGDRSDPGDRKSAFDFRLHVPGLSKILTIYADSYSDDDPNPIDAPRRVIWSPGVYLARVPYLSRFDARFEMVSSEELSQDEFNGGHFFINSQYRDPNTNKGFFLGTPVGRDGRAFEGRIGFWSSAKSKLEVGYRQNKGGNFLPGESTISDGFLTDSLAISPTLSLQTFFQYERYLIPSFTAGSHHNASGWFQLTWSPKINRGL